MLKDIVEGVQNESKPCRKKVDLLMNKADKNGDVVLIDGNEIDIYCNVGDIELDGKEAFIYGMDRFDKDREIDICKDVYRVE